ncbi:MAG TPA: glycosyltransferase [Pyrinomonadaceae bacterium]|jgi:Glycosyltransferases involved in cell wall biogenesis|nr:glycosyltransferase [Pyrinomonadaceae bacterium]
MNIGDSNLAVQTSSSRLHDRNLPDTISVVITCYNQAHYLSESIESVLAQTYQKFEITVVDDGSVDDAENVTRRYPGIRFVGQENQGVSVARNNGSQLGTGQHIVFLDADDRILKDALEVGVECFRSNPAYGFVFGRGRLIDSDGNQLPTPKEPLIDDADYCQLLQRNPIGFPALVMLSRNAFESVGGFRSFIGESFIGNTADYDLYLRIASQFPIHFHGATVAEWRQHLTNTSRNSLMMMLSCISVLNNQKENAKANQALRNALKAGKKRVCKFYGEQLIDELRSDLSNGKLTTSKLARSLVALLRYYPEGIGENVWTKIQKLTT